MEFSLLIGSIKITQILNLLINLSPETKLTIISPSLLSADFINLEDDITTLNQCENIWFHLDIMDGHFVPNLTFGAPIIKRISEVAIKPLDAHLMVTNPEFHIDLLKKYNIHNFTFHLEASNDPIKTIQKAKEIYSSVGISLRPKTPLEQLSIEILKSIDLLLVMSVEPGFGGQSFIESTWERLKSIAELKRQHHLNFTVQIDGGVSNINSHQLIEAGCNNLVAGSYVFKKGRNNITQQINSLRP